MNSKSLIESLLFVSSKPLSLRELSSFLKKEKTEVEDILKSLIFDYNEGDRGVRIIESDKKYQMASSPENAKVVRGFLQSEVSGELTPASLETLTIIAYRGPIKKSDLEKIRGINCSLILRNLLIRGLIEEKSDKEDEDKEYSVSLDFVKFLGINSVKDLPEYDKFNKNEEIDKLLGKISLEADIEELENMINLKEGVESFNHEDEDENNDESEDDEGDEDEDDEDDEYEDNEGDEGEDDKDDEGEDDEGDEDDEGEDDEGRDDEYK